MAADPGIELRQSLLAGARESYAAGDVRSAWRLCEEVAALSRVAGDVLTLADAAMVVRAAPQAPETALVHGLCAEALAALGDRDPVRAGKLRAQLVATSSPWDRATTESVPVDDGEAAFLTLQARHTELQHVSHVAERLALGDEAVALGLRTGDDEYRLWGLTWRLGAHAELGDRVAQGPDLVAFGMLVSRGDRVVWSSRLARIHATQLTLDGRFAEATAALDDAMRLAEGSDEARFLDLVATSHLAMLTGDGLEQAIADVRRAIDGAPFQARGWLAELLVAAGRLDEARDIWHALAPRVSELPERAPEWLIATVGYASLCTAFEDASAAEVLHSTLLPFAQLDAIGSADTPSYGPVALTLGRLARVRGDLDGAQAHLSDALARAEASHSLPFVATTHLELARLSSGPLRHSHAGAALRLARRLGMRPLESAVEELLAGATDNPLSPRETELVRRVAGGLSNADIAHELYLSERTVESHLSHAFRKLGVSNRAAAAAWYVATLGAPS